MTCASDHYEFTSPARPGVIGGGGSLFRRVREAVLAWGEHDGEARMASRLLQSGGRLTDNMEREIFQRRTMSDWSVDA